MRSFPDVDAYLADAERWPDEIAVLRPVLLGAGLTEEIKWGKPCYTRGGKNIAILQEMKDFLALMFFKGTLLQDPEGVLVDQGAHSRSSRRIEFTSVEDVERLADTVRSYLDEAIEVEEAGLRVAPPPEPDLVAELRDRFARDPALEAAFESLTPGRRREYNLYFGGAKQAKTRQARIARNVARIRAGKGLRER